MAELDRGRERRIGHLAHMFGVFASSDDPSRHSALYQFYGKMPGLDQRMPHFSVTGGARHLYEEDFSAVRAELRKLGPEELERLAENVDRIAAIGDTAGPQYLRH